MMHGQKDIKLYRR